MQVRMLYQDTIKTAEYIPKVEKYLVEERRKYGIIIVENSEEPKIPVKRLIFLKRHSDDGMK